MVAIHMFLLFVFVCMLVCTWVAGARPDLAPSVLSFWDGFVPHAADPEPPTPQAIRRSARTSPGTTQRKRLTPLQKKKVGAWAHWRCQLCGGELTYTYEVDHIRPVSRGGTNDFSNLRALCRECHGKVSLAVSPAEAAVKFSGLSAAYLTWRLSRLPAYQRRWGEDPPSLRED